MTGIMRVIRPVCIAMILSVIVILSEENYILNGQVNLIGIGISLIAFYLIRKWKWSVSKVIIGCALMGIVCFGIL